MGLCGTAETLRDDAADDDVASGLFLKLMEYTLERDEKLASIAKGIPKYTSKDIQNEIIETLADMVLGEIRKTYENADSAGFCLNSDGTSDRCDVENLSVMIQFVSNSMPEEHLIGLLDLHQLDAEYITSEILTHLSDAGYSADNILSQCYDGASVMSGVRGGVQALLEKEKKKSGLQCQFKRHHFFETGKFLVQVLGVLKPANAILQSQSVDMCSASEVVGAPLESLKNICEEEYWAELS